VDVVQAGEVDDEEDGVLAMAPGPPVLRRDGPQQPLVPLAERLGGLASPANWHTPAFGLLGLDDAARAELASELFALGRRRVSLAFVPAHGLGLGECRAAAAAADYRLLERTIERSPYVSLEGTFDEYLKSLDRKRVKEVRRLRRRLEEVGRVTFEVEDGGARLDELLDECFALEAAGWKGRTGTAIASRRPARDFYASIARWGAERGWLRLTFVRVDGRAAAFDLHLEQHGSLYALKGGYDEALRSFGPGMLATWEVLAYAFARGLRTYELLGSAERYKLAWTDRVRERMLLRAFAPGPAGLVEFAAYAYGRPLARRALALWRR
jgi:CelD/BcsL family acetyltransferase involved in cellulose biosynthesis